jgi:hypothetical protein
MVSVSPAAEAASVFVSASTVLSSAFLAASGSFLLVFREMATATACTEDPMRWASALKSADVTLSEEGFGVGLTGDAAPSRAEVTALAKVERLFLHAAGFRGPFPRLETEIPWRRTGVVDGDAVDLLDAILMAPLPDRT